MIELTEPRDTSHVRLLLHPSDGVHHEIGDLSLRRMRRSSDAELSDPYALIEPGVCGFYVGFESFDVIP